MHFVDRGGYMVSIVVCVVVCVGGSGTGANAVCCLSCHPRSTLGAIGCSDLGTSNGAPVEVRHVPRCLTH